MTTGHVAGVLAEHEHSRRSLLVGLAEATHGDAGGLVVANLLVHNAGLLGVAETRLQSVDANAVLSPLGGETLDHVGDSALRRVVEHLGQRVIQALLVVDLGAHRRSDDNRAVLKAGLNPVLSHRLGSVEHTKDVDVEDLVEVIRSELSGRLHHRNTGVRSETGHLAQLLLSLLHSLLDLLSIAHIALVGLDLNTELLGHLSGVLLSVRVRVVEDGHIGASLRSRLADAKTTKCVNANQRLYVHATVATADNNSTRKLDFENHGWDGEPRGSVQGLYTPVWTVPRREGPAYARTRLIEGRRFSIFSATPLPMGSAH